MGGKYQIRFSRQKLGLWGGYIWIGIRKNGGIFWAQYYVSVPVKCLKYLE